MSVVQKEVNNRSTELHDRPTCAAHSFMFHADGFGFLSQRSTQTMLRLNRKRGSWAMGPQPPHPSKNEGSGSNQLNKGGI